MRLRLLAFATAAALAAWPAAAGPPYATDDPEPTERGKWEIFSFVNGGHTPGETAGEAGLDFNYGGAKDLQLTFVIPAAYTHDGSTDAGMGVVELAAKYKLVHQVDGTAIPDVAIFPRVFLPTAPSRFASQRANLLLPVWLGKDAGPWSVFGGGGYQINPGSGNRDFWTGGLALTREINDRLAIGGEVYGHTRDGDDARDFAGLNLGVTYRLTDHWTLMASGGPGLTHARDEGQYDFYLALQSVY